jgi:hypothetical protein
MAVVAPHGYTTRAYYGTDCRAQALLVGAAIAIGLVLWRDGSRRPWFTRSAGVAGVLGVLGTAALWATASESSTFAFSGGFLVASLAAGAVVLACTVAPRSLAVRFLELPPFPQWGRISYGMYLWYWPVLLVMTGQRLHWGVYPLFLARIGVTVALAALSYDLVEAPIRHGARRTWRSWAAAPVGAAVAIGSVFVSTLVPVGATELQGAPISIPAHGTSTKAPALGSGSGSGSEVGTGHTTAAAVPPPATYLSLPLPAASGVTNRPVRVLLVGDSVAGTLGVGLAQYAQMEHDNVQIVNEGDPGCSVSMQSQIKVLWYTLAPGPPCDVKNNPDSLFATWTQWVDDYNPDVVLYVSRGETFDQDVSGRWQNIGQPGFDDYVTNRYREAVSVLGSRGATVVLMTSPYYDSGTSSSGTPWPEDAFSRVQLDNATIRQVASSAGSPSPGGAAGASARVFVFDLNAVVDPNGQYDASINNVNVRCGDGVHFSPSGGIYVGLRLLPDLVALGQSHAVSSPGGVWPGALPPSVPSWFPSLPCQ